MLTSNIDGYIPLKFETGRTYSVSCDGVPQGSFSTSSSNQRRIVKSPESNEVTQRQPANGLTSSSLTEPTDSRVSNQSQANKPLSHQASSNSKADRLKAIIQNDKSGNAMQRLQVAAAASRSLQQSTKGGQRSTGLPADEPVKPPRRGGPGNKMSKAARSDDFMNVTAAV